MSDFSQNIDEDSNSEEPSTYIDSTAIEAKPEANDSDTDAVNNLKSASLASEEDKQVSNNVDTSVSATENKKEKATKAGSSAKTAKKPVAKNTKTKSPIAKSTKTKASNVKSKTAKKAKGDNIKKINGIGPVFEKKLNSIGVNKFEHIAAWSDEDITRIDEQLELSGRPQREEWVRKATILAAEKNS